MAAAQNPVTFTPKEQIDQHRFLKWDVYKTPGKRAEREEKLEKALKLGNQFKNTVKIYFMTEDEEVKATEATVWMVSDSHISIKAGKIIPVHAIIDVEFL